MARTGRLRLGIFSYLEGPGTAAGNFANAMALYTTADTLGIDVAWVAQHHFGNLGGLPSPFVFFGSLAARTRQIGCGTAVITLPIEDPLKIAEEAAVLDTLHPGRLQLGLGTGFTTEPVLEVFGKGGQDKRALYNDGVVRIYSHLRGTPVEPVGQPMYPPAGDLVNRVWEAPGSPTRVKEAARRGSGLLLSRIAIGVFDRSTDDVQRELVDAYYSALPSGV